MAGYKQPCMHCGTFIESDARLCTGCGSMNPFGYLCPTCGGQTFVQERCEVCGSGLMVYCENKRCGALQFFQNTKCTACGKKIKAKKGGR